MWRTVSTRWSDNDSYGHVNNTIHYQWFDTAVNAWLIAGGLIDIGGGDAIALVVETGCRYAASLSYPQDVEIGLAVDTIGGSSVRYRIGVFAAAAADAAAEGHFVHVLVDRADRRPVPFPARWRVALEGIRR